MTLGYKAWATQLELLGYCLGWIHSVSSLVVILIHQVYVVMLPYF